MSKLRMIHWLGAGVLTVALVFPLPAQEGPTKIKVIVENASIRLKPSLDSEAIEENIAVGTIYNSDKKVGEWYEIKFESRLGIALLGYVHEMYVEALGEAAAPPPEVRQPERRPEPPPVSDLEGAGADKLEIFIGGGMGFGSFLNQATNYMDDWTLGFVNGHEEGEIKHKVNNPFGLGLSVGYFLSESLGFRVRLDPGFGQKISGGQSLYAVDYSGWGDMISYGDEWDVSGSLSVMPLSFDLVYRFPSSSFCPYINAGLSMFLGSFKADTTVGWGYAWYVTYPTVMTIDYAKVAASIDEKLNGLGANLGAGFDLRLGAGLAVTLDAAYFLGGKKDLGWYVAPGQYDFVKHAGASVNFDQAAAQHLSDVLGSVQVSLSFFKVLIGIKLFL
ncbi:MAG TPA: outer membrane beta-barrel protein [Acidobacteriota bacterium]